MRGETGADLPRQQGSPETGDDGAGRPAAPARTGRHAAAEGIIRRGQDAPGAVCAASGDGVPGCDTGPAGRIAFVARELADLWRELRGHARTTPGPDTDEDQQ